MTGVQRCLFVTPILPGNRDTGGLLFSQLVIDMLRRHGLRVRVLGWQEAGARVTIDADTVSAGTRAIVTRQHPLAAAGWLLRALARGEPYSLAKFRGARFDRELVRMLADADLVVIDHQLDWVFVALPPGVPVIHLSHQLASEIYATRRSPLHRREARLLRRAERRIARAADQIWTITPDDRDTYRMLGAAQVLDLPFTPDPPPSVRYHPPAHDIVLLGTWTWAPNRVGLTWFIDRIAPLLPDLTIAVAGRGAVNGGMDHVTAIGPVEDAAGFLRSGRAIAIPSRAGVGLQTKSLHAIAMGPPVVATSHALRHIDERPAHLSLAETPEAFAAALRAAVMRPPAQAGDPFATRRAALHRAMERALASIGVPAFD